MNHLPYDPASAVDQPAKAKRGRPFGSGQIWTFEKCTSSALVFETRTEWLKAFPSAYQAARKNGWLDVCCAHMKKDVRRIWTLEKCIEEARKHPSASEWELKSPASYGAAKKAKWLALCNEHMVPKDSISVIYHGIKYPSINACLIAIGAAESWSDAHKKFGGNIGRMVKHKGFTFEQAIDMALSKQGKVGDRQEQAAKKIRIAAEAYRLEELKHIEFWSQSFVSDVIPCKVCGKLHRPGGRGFCSDECRLARKTELSKIQKVRVRSAGLDNRAKPRKRHAKYGGKYDRTITAQSVAMRDGMRCKMCGIRVTKHKGQGWQPNGWSVGHIIPVSKGGNTTWDNVRCECIKCNTHKGTDVIDRGGQLSMMLMHKHK